jgi:hypothetical protein
MNETLKHEAQQIWQSQPVEGTKVSIEAIRLRAGKFERKIARRNLRETVAGVVVMSDEILQRITWGLFIAGLIWVIAQLHLKGAPRTPPADVGSATCVDFFRSELERQRDLVKNVWHWYLAPLVPGYLALNAAWVFASPRVVSWTRLTLLDAFFVAVFVGVWEMNQRAARRLQRSIDGLPAAEPPRAEENKNDV